MADNLSMALAELLRKADAEPDMDTLREGVRVMTQALMELEVAQHLGAERYQRTPERQGERNGYRDRSWDTRVGSLELRVPRVRDGSFFPGLLEPRKRAERALGLLGSPLPEICGKYVRRLGVCVRGQRTSRCSCR
jgi:putative transposase